MHESTGSNCDNVSLTLNGQPFVVDFVQRNNSTTTQVSVQLDEQTIDLTVQGYCDQNQSQTIQTFRQVLFFDINLLNDAATDSPPSFTLLLDSSEQEAQALVIPHPDSSSQCLSTDTEFDAVSARFLTDDDLPDQSPEHASLPEDAPVASDDPTDSPVKELRARLNEEKNLIRRLTMDCRKDFVEDLRKCDHDLKCSSKAICSHFHDAMIRFMSNLRTSLQQSPLVSEQRQWQAIVAGEKPSADDSASQTSDSSNTNNIILLALETLAGVFGLAGLFGLIRRHCRSFRRRAERLADREERKRAREYRRLARREALRKNWVAFKRVVRLPCRNSGCEEKAALVIEAAAHGVNGNASFGDIEQVWNSVSPAEQDYLTSLAESSRRQRTRDKDGDTRSRSSSLPSYESEKLPDYTTRPDHGMVMVDGYRIYAPSIAATSINTAVTPDSSMLNLSPRCSGETLRTVMSRD